jgi:AAA domain
VEQAAGEDKEALLRKYRGWARAIVRWGLSAEDVAHHYDVPLEEVQDFIRHRPAQQKKRSRLVPFAKIKPDLARPQLVDDLLDVGALTCVYGEPKKGKTFIVLDLALHIALGQKWFGRDVEQGAVIYIAAEGSGSVEQRIEAFKQYHGLRDRADVPFYLLPGRFLALDDTDIQQLINEARAISGVSLIVLDTVARTMGGAEENSAKEMGLFIRACDRLREETGAHVLAVHHAGKDKSRGARGSNALLGAVDGEMRCTAYADRYMLEDTNQRNRGHNGAIWFRLHDLCIGHTAKGKPVMRGVVVPAEAGVVDEQLSPAEQHILETLGTNTLSQKALLDACDLKMVSEGASTPKNARTRGGAIIAKLLHEGLLVGTKAALSQG